MKLKSDTCHLVVFSFKYEQEWIKIAHDTMWESTEVNLNLKVMFAIHTIFLSNTFISNASSIDKNYLVLFPVQAITPPKKKKRKQTTTTTTTTKNWRLKEFLIFHKMELYSSNIKKILIFLEIKPCTFRSQLSQLFAEKRQIISQRKATEGKERCCWILFLKFY